MNIVAELIHKIPIIRIEGSTSVSVNLLVLDSRKATKNCMFFAQKGTQTDGHHYISEVIEQGAKAIVCEDMPNALKEGVCYIQVRNVAEVIGLIASNFYVHPSKELKVIGVTGTNGKTTIVTLLFRLFSNMGFRCGLISTVENKIKDKTIIATHTTPDAISLQQLFRQMSDEDCTHVFMEVSSHAIHQQRINGVEFDGGVFTNITHDHLDYHASFDEYIQVKKSFFDRLPPDAFALTNGDEKRGMVMLQNTKANKQTYALKIPANFKGKVLENQLDGLLMNIAGQEVHFRLSGWFNAYNLLAVYAVAYLCGEDKMKILSVLSSLKAPAGRFETLRSKREQILGIIDYAHTPDALLNVLTTIKQLGNDSSVYTVVGCGGDRDKAKRPLMAAVAATHSDKVIFTSDNPRTESPEEILNEMEVGLNPSHRRKVIRITDRKEAIKTAVSFAQKNDIILIAGKGHETYQEINGFKHHFDDKEILQEMFELLER